MRWFVDEVDLLARIIRLVNQCRTTVLATPLDVSPTVDPDRTMQIGSVLPLLKVEFLLIRLT